MRSSSRMVGVWVFKSTYYVRLPIYVDGTLVLSWMSRVEVFKDIISVCCKLSWHTCPVLMLSMLW